MIRLTARCIARPTSIWGAVAFTLIVVFAAAAHAQPANDEVPEGIFVNLTRVPGWGPFIPRADFPPEHHVGSFSVRGQTYRVHLLRHANRGIEDRVLIQPADADVPASEGDGLTVSYRYEAVDFDGTAYEIQGISPVNGQFVLTKKEDVQYAHYGLRRGDAVPPFQNLLLEGRDLSNADLGGSYTLIHFWGTWCGPCHGEVPFLAEAHDRFGDQIQFIGVAVDDDREAVLEYIAERGITWPQVSVPNTYPITDELVSSFRVRGYPTNYLIGPDGRILVGADQRMRLRGERLLETLTRVVYDADN